jgi:hypothetical protein
MYYTDFYIPMVNTEVDIDRLKKELDHFVKIDYNMPVKARSFGITTTKEFATDPFFNFRKHQTISQPDENGVRRLPDGSLDSDVTVWPTIMEGSYMKELTKTFNDILQLENPRVRASVTNGPSKLELHHDEHTPYRVHICLQTGPGANWIFMENNGLMDTIHQPRTNNPVLINAGTVKHGLNIPAGVQRIHLWYQYHKPVSSEILNKLKNDIEIKKEQNASPTA